MGDTFNNVSNSTIATRGSTIALEGAIAVAQGAILQGVNTLNQQGQQDVGKAFSDLEALISKASDLELSLEKKAESLGLLKGVVEEAAKPNPNKTTLKVLGNGLWEVVKSVPTVLASAKALWPLISPLWA